MPRSTCEACPPMRADIVPGAVFPDYELSDHRGKHRTLSELQEGDPLVLVLSRGGFCPKDRRQHEGLLQLHREMQVGYCRLVTISTDNLLETNEFRAGVGAHWTFLSDPGRKLQKDLDIAEYTDPDHNPMIPHTLVLEPGLRVYKIYNGYWFFGRPTVEELRLDLRAVLQRCRPIGTSAARSSEQPGRRARRPVSIRTEKRRRRCSPKRTDPARLAQMLRDFPADGQFDIAVDADVDNDRTLFNRQSLVPFTKRQTSGRALRRPLRQ